MTSAADRVERSTPIRWILLGGAAVAVLAAGRWFAPDVLQLAHWASSQGGWGMAVFVLGYALAVTALVPAWLLTMSAGAIYGLATGTVLVFAGAVAGSSLAFLLARYVLRGPVEHRLARWPRFSAVDHAVADAGFRLVVLLRLSPVFPFTLLNYALGVSRVRFSDYVLASIGMLPGTLLYVYYGKLAGELAGLSGAATPRGTGYWLVLGAGLAATAAVTAMVVRLARRALDERLANDGQTAPRAS